MTGLIANAPGAAARESSARSVARLGIVDYANVAPLHYHLKAGDGVEFVRGVPTQLNAMLLSGEIDLTLISSSEFLRHRNELVALPDFSIATLGPVYSVALFHWRPWDELQGSRIAVSTDSATSVALLEVLLRAEGRSAQLVPMEPDLDAMLAACDGAMLIGDAALSEGVRRRSLGDRQPLFTDLGEAWYAQTRLPFTFAVWAARKDRPPAATLVARLRAAREQGLGHLAEVAHTEAERLDLAPNVVQRYLSNFRYYFEPADRDGLLAFAERAVPDFMAKELEFWDL